jgi:hypothetical protein
MTSTMASAGLGVGSFLWVAACLRLGKAPFFGRGFSVSIVTRAEEPWAYWLAVGYAAAIGFIGVGGAIWL